MLKKIKKPSVKAKKSPDVNPKPPVVDRVYFDKLAEEPIDQSDRDRRVYHYIELLKTFGAQNVYIQYLDGHFEISGTTGNTEYYGPADKSLQRAVFFFVKHIMKSHQRMMWNLLQGIVDRSQA